MARTKINTRDDTKTLTTSWRNRHLENKIYSAPVRRFEHIGRPLQYFVSIDFNGDCPGTEQCPTDHRTISEKHKENSKKTVNESADTRPGTKRWPSGPRTITVRAPDDVLLVKLSKVEMRRAFLEVHIASIYIFHFWRQNINVLKHTFRLSSWEWITCKDKCYWNVCSIVSRCPVGHRKMLSYTDASRCPFEMWPRTDIMLESFQCLVIFSFAGEL